MPDLTTAARELLEYPRIIGAETMPDEVYVPIDFVEEMERALRSALEASGWQPISTAPKDVRCLIGWRNGAQYTCIATYVAHDEMWVGDNGFGCIEPTHWQPLPAPPEAKP